jgi:molybdopterin-guanine dinucleotide biosynthesis protein
MLNGVKTRPRIIAVGGYSSNCGKTTTVCRLLAALPGWEAIKVTKGHYRSCGKDPHACCVSHLLEDAPVVRTGRDENFAEGKDTARYWEAGAANVHWVIATKAAVDEGVATALERVSPDAAGVIVEGTSVILSLDAQFSIVCATAEQAEIKASTVAVLPVVDAMFVFGSRRSADALAVERRLLELARSKRYVGDLPMLYFDDEFDRLLARATELMLQSSLGPATLAEGPEPRA